MSEPIEFKVWITATRYYDGKVRFEAWGSDVSVVMPDKVLVGTFEFWYAIPASFNMTAMEIAALEAAKEKLQEEYLKQKARLDQKINDLLMLGHEVVEVLA